MLLKILRLKNIRSYKTAKIHFSSGSSLLLGDIGSGKTTILLAIEFAFFGIIKGDVSGETLLRHGERDGEVELTFDLDGRKVTILRRLKRGRDSISQDSGKIITEGMVFDATPVELKSKMLEMFGYPQDLLNKNTSLIYRYTVYTPQEEMKHILFEGQEERLDTLRRIFCIDRYKRIRENALLYAKELRSTKRILESRTEGLDEEQKLLEEKSSTRTKALVGLDEERIRCDRIKSELESKSKELGLFEEQITMLLNLKKDLEVNAVTIKAKSAELERNSKDIGIAEYRIKEYNERLGEIGSPDVDEEQLRKELDDSEEKLNKINSAREVISKRLDDKQRDIKNITIDNAASLAASYESISARLAKKQETESKIKELQEKLDALSLAISSSSISKFNSEKIVSQIKDLSICPLCLQNVDLSHKVKITDKENANMESCSRNILDLKGKKSNLELDIEEMKIKLEEIHSLEIELKATTMRLENLKRQEEMHQQLAKEIEELSAKKQKLDAMDIGKLVDKISRDRKILNNIAVKKHIQDSLNEKKTQKDALEESSTRIRSELKELDDKCAELQSKIAGLSSIEEGYRSKRLEIERISSTLKDSQIRLVTLAKDKELMDSEIERTSRSIAQKISYKAKASYISELIFWISEHLVNLSSTIERAVMQSIHAEFDSLFQKWFNMLMDDEEMDVRVDEEFTPIIMQNGFETDAQNLSGGEKTSVALAYRLALNKVINDLISTIKTKDIIILDEPTDGFSSEQLDKMRDVLYELDMGQMVLVSHEPKMESYVENIIRIAKREHTSSIS